LVEVSLHKSVKRAVDPNNLSSLEKEHVPVVIGSRWYGAGSFKQVCRVTPQQPLMLAVWVHHEMTENHHIKAIAIGDGEKDLTRAYLSPNHSIPRMHLTVKLTESKTLKIHVCCSKHGCWETAFPVQVVSREKLWELYLKEATEVISEEFYRDYG